VTGLLDERDMDVGMVDAAWLPIDVKQLNGRPRVAPNRATRVNSNNETPPVKR